MPAPVDDEFLCRVGRRTAMGDTLRRYWAPVCPSSSLPAPDGDPIPVTLFGERLVAFRDSNGDVGVLDERCPHRGVSLVYGRNEDCGLRCLYHGWKIGVDGTIQETPNISATRVAERLTATAYPVHEAGGLVWAYLGPPDHRPSPPAFWWSGLPGERLEIDQILVRCNWVQLLEGAIDSSHIDHLHRDTIAYGRAGELATGDDKGKQTNFFPTAGDPPRLEVQQTAFGFQYAAIRTALDADDDKRYVRVTPYIAPFTTIIPPGSVTIMWVPLDDTTTAQYGIRVVEPGEETDPDVRRKFSGLVRRGEGAWGDDGYVVPPPQDRAAMARGESWSGWVGNRVQDAAMNLSQGEMHDRSVEHLVASDIAIIKMRRLLVESAQRVRDGGSPVGVDASVSTNSIRAASGILGPDEAWQDLVPGNQPLDEVEVVDV